MSWKYYLLLITLFILFVACLPLIFRSNRDAAREWMSGYAGLLAIAAAVIASIPVFQQLDEARLATKNIKIQLISGAQRALDDERGRVDEIEKIAEDSMGIHALKSNLRTEAASVWKIRVANIVAEMSQKTDKPPFLAAARTDLAQNANSFLAMLQAFDEAQQKPELISVVESSGGRLYAACQSYDKASHNQIEQMHLKISEAEKELLDY